MAEFLEDKASRLGDIAIVLGICALSVILVFATEGYRKDLDKKELIGKDLCKTNNFIYDRIDSIHQTIVCQTNISVSTDHYNITPETLEVTIKPDWDYYQKNETAK